MATTAKMSPLRHAMFGRARTGGRPAGQMNQLEARYANCLQAQLLDGKILRWDYERVTFILAHGRQGVRGLRYTPDFMVIALSGEVSFHETKGHMDAKNVNKLKQAAEMFPFRFYLVKFEAGATVLQEM